MKKKDLKVRVAKILLKVILAVLVLLIIGWKISDEFSMLEDFIAVWIRVAGCMILAAVIWCIVLVADRRSIRKFTVLTACGTKKKVFVETGTPLIIDTSRALHANSGFADVAHIKELFLGRNTTKRVYFFAEDIPGNLGRRTIGNKHGPKVWVISQKGLEDLRAGKTDEGIMDFFPYILVSSSAISVVK